MLQLSFSLYSYRVSVCIYVCVFIYLCIWNGCSSKSTLIIIMLLVFLFFISYSHLSFSLSPHFTLFIFRVSSSICSTTERHLRSFNLQSIRLFLIIYKMFFFRFLLFLYKVFTTKFTQTLRIFCVYLGLFFSCCDMFCNKYTKLSAIMLLIECNCTVCVCLSVCLWVC